MDTFARFVDVLATSLDDHGASGEELASRLHLSRSHFDRIVSAAAGEPPAALRRRVLLERAAYRLLASDDELLPVAIDAGYSSHEAFTRAFARAYGEPPSRWRLRAHGFELDAPSGVHFRPPASLRLPSQRKVTGMDLVNRMVEHHVWLVGELLERAERLTPGQLEQPVELSVEGIDDEPTVRRLLARLVGQLAMWHNAITSKRYDFGAERDWTLPEIREVFATAGPTFLEDVRSIVRDERLDETFVDVTCESPVVFTYGGMVAHVLTFGSHRRTLVLGAFADAGITDLGAGDPIHWVGEAA